MFIFILRYKESFLVHFRLLTIDGQRWETSLVWLFLFTFIFYTNNLFYFIFVFGIKRYLHSRERFTNLEIKYRVFSCISFHSKCFFWNSFIDSLNILIFQELYKSSFVVFECLIFIEFKFSWEIVNRGF